jgi:hypothetical protein
VIRPWVLSAVYPVPLVRSMPPHCCQPLAEQQQHWVHTLMVTAALHYDMHILEAY